MFWLNKAILLATAIIYKAVMCRGRGKLGFMVRSAKTKGNNLCYQFTTRESVKEQRKT